MKNTLNICQSRNMSIEHYLRFSVAIMWQKFTLLYYTIVVLVFVSSFLYLNNFVWSTFNINNHQHEQNSNIPKRLQFSHGSFKSICLCIVSFQIFIDWCPNNVFVNNSTKWLHVVKTSIWLTRQDNKVVHRNSFRQIPDSLTLMFIRINKFFFLLLLFLLLLPSFSHSNRKSILFASITKTFHNEDRHELTAK